MLSQSGALLPLTGAAAPQQRVGRLGCCVDTGTLVAKEGVALPAAHRVAECSLFDAPPQSDPGCGLDCQDLSRLGGEVYPEKTCSKIVQCSFKFCTHNSYITLWVFCNDYLNINSTCGQLQHSFVQISITEHSLSSIYNYPYCP